MAMEAARTEIEQSRRKEEIWVFSRVIAGTPFLSIGWGQILALPAKSRTSQSAQFNPQFNPRKSIQ
jgi:hypothetical protein